MDRRSEIYDQVLILARKYSLVKNAEINGDTKLVDDLDLYHDETDLILAAQKKIGCKPPVEAWLPVVTVDDMVDLLLRYSS